MKNYVMENLGLIEPMVPTDTFEQAQAYILRASANKNYTWRWATEEECLSITAAVKAANPKPGMLGYLTGIYTPEPVGQPVRYGYFIYTVPET